MLQDEVRDRVAERILTNHLGAADVPPAAHRAMRAATGMLQLALYDWASGRGASREETRTMIIETILAVVSRVVPAVLEVEPTGESG